MGRFFVEIELEGEDLRSRKLDVEVSFGEGVGIGGD